MKSRLASFLAALCLSLPITATAQNSPVVVELYTSQGCSSCPPADELMHTLAEREDVIALALHVDYWDYIGWKDDYADPAHTQRQQRYAHEGGRNMIYTPQMIINGRDDVVGARSMELADLIAKHRAAAQPQAIRAYRKDGQVVIESLDGATPGAMGEIHLVRYDPMRVSKITRGENAGRTLTYVNVVDDWQVLGRWDGSAPLSLVAQLDGDLPAVVLLQAPGPGRILSAARVE